MALSAEDRERLRGRFREYQAGRDPAVRDELVAEHYRLAVHLAHRFAHRGIPLDDLIQVASLGLLNAVERFDPERDIAFSTYATPTIVGEMKRHFRDKGWSVRVPRPIQELHLRLHGLVGQLTQDLGRSPTIAELARAARTSQEEVLEAMEASNAYRANPLEPAHDPDAHAAATDESDESDLSQVENRLLIEHLLRTLPRRERLILMLRYYEEMSQAQIGERLGISQMHVSRLLQRSLDQLRSLIDEDPGGTSGSDSG